MSKSRVGEVVLLRAYAGCSTVVHSSGMHGFS